MLFRSFYLFLNIKKSIKQTKDINRHTRLIIFIVFTTFFLSLIFVRSLLAPFKASQAHWTSFSLDALNGIRFISTHKGIVQLLYLIAFNGYMHMGVFLVVVN